MSNRDTVLCYDKEPNTNFEVFTDARMDAEVCYFCNCAVSVPLFGNMYVQVIASIFALGSSGAGVTSLVSVIRIQIPYKKARRTNYQMSYFWPCSCLATCYSLFVALLNPSRGIIHSNGVEEFYPRQNFHRIEVTFEKDF